MNVVSTSNEVNGNTKFGDEDTITMLWNSTVEEMDNQFLADLRTALVRAGLPVALAGAVDWTPTEAEVVALGTDGQDDIGLALWSSRQAEAAATEDRISATLAQFRANIVARSKAKVPVEVLHENEAMLETALRYAARGLRVIAAERFHPEAGTYSNVWRYRRDMAAGIVNPDVDSKASKRPLGSCWQERASTDFDAIRDTFERLYWRSKKRGAEGHIPVTYPVNLSIVTGERSGYFVLDVDGEKGRANLKALEAERGALPATLKSISGSGSGDHFIFRLPPNVRLYNTQKQFGGAGSDLDIRGENGQIIAAPSVHESGGVYRWAPGCSPDDIAIADAPAWVIDEAIRTSKKAQAESAILKSCGTVAPAGDDEGDDYQDPDAYVPSGEPIKVTGAGLQSHLDAIGDGAGRRGFHEPIFAAMCAFFLKHSPNANADALKATLKATIAAAPLKPERRSVDRYLSDEYLDEDLDNARRFAAERLPKPFASVEEAEAAIAACEKRALAAESLAKRIGCSQFTGLEVDSLCSALAKRSGAGKRGLKNAVKDSAVQTKHSAAKAEKATPGGNPAWLPDGWIVSKGFYYDADGGTVCPAFSRDPVHVRDPDGDGWALDIGFADKDGREKSLVISWRRIQNDRPGVRGDFAKAGLAILNSDPRKDSFSVLMVHLTGADLEKRMEVKRPGWSKDFRYWFSSAGVPVGFQDGSTCCLSAGGGVTDRSQGGTLEGERSLIELIFSMNGPHWYRPFGLLAGLSGPVGQLAGIESGGFWMWGETGTGKSTASHIAVMPFSNPDKGGNWHKLGGTIASGEGVLIHGTGNAVVFDEAKGEKAEKQAIALAHMVHGEGERDRMDYTQSSDQVQNKKKTNWHVGNVLVTSESSMEAVYKNQRTQLAAGEVSRIVPLMIPQKESVLLASDDPRKERLEAWRRNYGNTGPVFVTHLLANGHNTEEGRAALKADLTRKVTALIEGWEAGARAATRFAAVWWTGEQAKRAGLIPADADVEAVVRSAWAAFLASPESGRLRGGEYAVTMVRNYLASNFARSLIDAHSSEERRSFAADGWFTDTHIYLLRDKLVAMTNGEFQLDVILRGLKPFCEQRSHAGRGSMQAMLVHDRVPVVGWGKMPHIRIDRAEFGMKDDGQGTAAGEVMTLDSLKAKAGELTAILEQAHWHVPGAPAGVMVEPGNTERWRRYVTYLGGEVAALTERFKMSTHR